MTKADLDVQESYKDLAFPFAGISLYNGFERQMPLQMPDGTFGRTCRDAVNVRAYEGATDRIRGGTRAGLVKYLPAPPVEGWIIQCLAMVVRTDKSAVG